MTESASNQFELEIDPSWTRGYVAEYLREIARLIEQGYNQGESWKLGLDWDIDFVKGGDEGEGFDEEDFEEDFDEVIPESDDEFLDEVLRSFIDEDDYSVEEEWDRFIWRTPENPPRGGGGGSRELHTWWEVQCYRHKPLWVIFYCGDRYVGKGRTLEAASRAFLDEYGLTPKGVEKVLQGVQCERSDFQYSPDRWHFSFKKATFGPASDE